MKAFKVFFECGNCGGKWSEEFDEGDMVREVAMSSPLLESHQCTVVDCPFCRFIKCPVCDCDTEAVSISKRSPLVKEA